MPLYRDTATRQGVEAPSGASAPGIEMLYAVTCGSALTFRYASLASDVDRQAVISDARDRAFAAIPQPSIDLNPSPEAIGRVNLGMWLAVNDPGQVSAFSNVGPVWAMVTARHTSVSFDMGNGDVVRCDGLGTPFPGGDIVEQGPCGYTYRSPDGGEGYTVTVTSHWEGRLQTSDGVNEPAGSTDTTFAFSYPVHEIVTVIEG